MASRRGRAPNVGKSSLINAIAGYQRAIVHDSPGTTRDIVGVQTAMGGWPVEISDTAGLREAGETIERVGIDLARQKILAADLIVLVFDRSLPWSDQDQALVDCYPVALLIHNKSDLPRAAGQRPSGLELAPCTRRALMRCARKSPADWCLTHRHAVPPYRLGRSRLSRSTDTCSEFEDKRSC